MITCVTNMTQELLRKSIHFYCKVGKYKKIRMFFNILSVMMLFYIGYYGYEYIIVLSTYDMTFLIMTFLIFLAAVFGIWFARYGVEWNLYHKTCNGILKEGKEGHAIRYTFDENGFITEVNGNTLFLKWDSIVLFLCDKEYYFYITQEQHIGIIDKNGFQKSEILKFEKLISDKVKTIKKSL